MNFNKNKLEYRSTDGHHALLLCTKQIFGRVVGAGLLKLQFSVFLFNTCRVRILHLPAFLNRGTTIR